MSLVGGDTAAVEGGDGWLFLERSEDVRPLEAAGDLGAWRQHVLPVLRQQFQSRAARCARHGAAFIALAGPEKASVYPDQLPAPYVREEPGAAELLAAACRKDGVRFLDLVTPLRRARGPMDVYTRTDSHWSMFGAWVAYNAIMDAVEDAGSGRRLAPSRISFRHKRGYGDLGVLMQPERKGWIQSAEIAGPEPHHVTDTRAERETAYQEFVCPEASGTALVVRDSFSTFLAPFLIRTFFKTVFAAPPTQLLDDMVQELKPDVVIFEVAERGLFATPDPLADWPPTSWRELFLESWDEAPGYKANEATRTALRTARMDEAAACATEAASQDVDHRFGHNLAAALVGAGRMQDALEACDAALRSRPDSRALHYYRALALRSLAEPEAAQEALRRALALQPDNARFLAVLEAWAAEDESAHDAARPPQHSEAPPAGPPRAAPAGASRPPRPAA